jgi:hypothetical protein
MKKEYFIIDIKEINNSYAFKMLENEEDHGIVKNVIAEDDFGNKLFIKNKKVYAYIHDHIKEKIKLYDSYQSFKEETKFHTRNELEKIQQQRIEKYRKENAEFEIDILVDIKTASVYLGKSKFDRKYIERFKYNISKAFSDKVITEDDFNYLKNK